MGREGRCSIVLVHTLADLGGKGVSGGNNSASTIFPCLAGKSLSSSRRYVRRDNQVRERIASFNERREGPRRLKLP